MNKKQAQQIIKNFELVKAFANGATIQYTEKSVEPRCWVDTETPIWAGNYEYRVKPEPEEFFITVRGALEQAIKKGCDAVRAGCESHATSEINFVGGIYPDLYGAIRHAGDWSHGGEPASRIFKVTEVVS